MRSAALLSQPSHHRWWVLGKGGPPGNREQARGGARRGWAWAVPAERRRQDGGAAAGLTPVAGSSPPRISCSGESLSDPLQPRCQGPGCTAGLRNWTCAKASPPGQSRGRRDRPQAPAPAGPPRSSQALSLWDDAAAEPLKFNFCSAAVDRRVRAAGRRRPLARRKRNLPRDTSCPLES